MEERLLVCFWKFSSLSLAKFHNGEEILAASYARIPLAGLRPTARDEIFAT